jgi:hypothetical protein
VQIKGHYPFGLQINSKPNSFTSKEDLYKIPWIKVWLDAKNFHQFSVCNSYLMAEMNSGSEWHVIGEFITPGYHDLGFTLWSPIRAMQAIRQQDSENLNTLGRMK